MGYDAHGPSGSALYNQAGGQGDPPDVGAGRAAALQNTELHARARYAEPVGGDVNGITPEQNERGIYNNQAMLPAKYSVPTAQKERMVAREAVRQGAKSNPTDGVMRTDPITDEEVSYLQAMKDQAELADFDRYVNSLVDPRKPGNLKWLMEVYPDFVHRRIQQVHTDYEYALRNQMIDSWGINTFDDLHFKYMVDQGKLDGPLLVTFPTGDGYDAGWLAPSKWKQTRTIGVNLPYTSATIGGKPRGPAMPDENQPLGEASSRDLTRMATSMYRTP